jgi:hypothetical protein
VNALDGEERIISRLWCVFSLGGFPIGKFGWKCTDLWILHGPCLLCDTIFYLLYSIKEVLLLGFDLIGIIVLLGLFHFHFVLSFFELMCEE